MTARERLNRIQIDILLSLFKRGGEGKPISISERLRKWRLPLWRRGIVEVWYRQAPGEQPSLQGPYYRLSLSSALLASQFLPAPRGSSGAEQSP